MDSSKLQLLLVSCSIFLAACQTTSATKIEGTAMDDAEVTSLISSSTIEATNSIGKKYMMYFGADGSLENSAGQLGTWEVTDGSICNTYIERGFAGCDKVYRDANNDIYYITPLGKTGYIHGTSAGNSL